MSRLPGSSAVASRLRLNCSQSLARSSGHRTATAHAGDSGALDRAVVSSNSPSGLHIGALKLKHLRTPWCPMVVSKGIRLRHVLNWCVVFASVSLSVYAIMAIAATPFASPVMSVVGPVFGILSLTASLVAICSPRTAARIDVWLMPVAPFVALVFHHPFGYGSLFVITESLLAFIGSVTLPGLFWRWTVRHSWPPPLPQAALCRHSWLAAISGFGVFCVLFVVALVWSFGILWLYPVGDCSSGPLFDRHGRPRYIDSPPGSSSSDHPRCEIVRCGPSPKLRSALRVFPDGIRTL